MQLAGFSLDVERTSTEGGMSRPHTEAPGKSGAGKPGVAESHLPRWNKFESLGPPQTPLTPRFPLPGTRDHRAQTQGPTLLFAEPVGVCSLCGLQVQLCFKDLRVLMPDLPRPLILAQPAAVWHRLQRQSSVPSVLGSQTICLVCRACFCPEPIFRAWVLLDTLSLFPRV